VLDQGCVNGRDRHADQLDARELDLRTAASVNGDGTKGEGQS
jgi:hypothetical protein